MKNKGFTLIELIVVITILAILGTIAFIGFKGYTSDARDSKVTTDIANLHNSLAILKATEGTLPIPDDSKTVTAGITKITYEGEVGDVVRNTLKASSDMKTPAGDNYKYAVSEDQKDFTLVGMLENDTASLGTTAFADSNADIKYFKGDEVLTVFDSNDNFVDADILSIDGSYKAYLGENTMENVSGKIQMNSCNDIKRAGYGTVDGNYIINVNGTDTSVYCDMTTHGGGWTRLDDNLVTVTDNDGANVTLTDGEYSGINNPQLCYSTVGYVAKINLKYSDIKIPHLESRMDLERTTKIMQCPTVNFENYVAYSYLAEFEENGNYTKFLTNRNQDRSQRKSHTCAWQSPKWAVDNPDHQYSIGEEQAKKWKLYYNTPENTLYFYSFCSNIQDSGAYKSTLWVK